MATMMTAAQIDAVERACERATVEHITVQAQGSIKANGVKFFLTNSASDPDGFHVVTWQRGRLHCNCQASQYGKVCKHAGAVRMYLEHQASRAQGRAEAVEAAMQRQASNG
jgi:hypothetical protein